MFNKGDKVKIKKLEPAKEHEGLWFSGDMRNIAEKNEIYTVEIFEENMKPYPIYFLEGVDLFFFNDFMLEKVD